MFRARRWEDASTGKLGRELVDVLETAGQQASPPTTERVARLCA
jgi:hypothetical protein